MDEFPIIQHLDQNPIRNIIKNALSWKCFNNDTNPLTRCNTTEVTIYNNTILASPIDNNEAVGETVHDFIGLGERCKVNGRHMGGQIASEYKVFLNVPNEYNGDTDDKVYNDALENIIGNPDISILTLDENEVSMHIINNLLQHGSSVSGHVTSNSVQNSPDFVQGTPMYGVGSPFTPDSVRNQYLDLIRAPLPRLREGLHSNKDNINVNTDLDSKNKTDYRNTLNEIFESKCNNVDDNSTSMFEVANDHGAKKLPQIVQVDKYSIFNTMYDRGTRRPEMVDTELLKLSYVYYSRNPTSGNIKGLLILLEENRDSNDSNGSKSGKKAKSDQITVNMKKYLFSSDSTMQPIDYRPVIDTAPNVSTLCSEMANGSIDAVEVALMKAAADRTLKIGALLSSVGITTDIIYFLTHDIKNYYYNKNLYVKKKSRDLQLFQLNAIYTSVYSRPTGQCSRRILISQYKSKVDSELQELINRKSISTKKCDTLRQEIENLNNDLNRLDELKQRIDLSKSIIEGKRRINNVNDIISEYSEYFYKYLDISSKICPDDDFNNSLSVSTEQIRRAPNLSINTKDEITEVFNLLFNKVSGCIGSVNKTKTMKIEQLTICDSELEFTNGLINNYNNNVSEKISFDESSQKEKGGKEIGGRRTKRSIKVITKRKKKVKSKTIKKKSRRRNKTRR